MHHSALVDRLIIGFNIPPLAASSLTQKGKVRGRKGQGKIRKEYMRECCQERRGDGDDGDGDGEWP